MRGLKQDRSARVVIAGHGFVQNVRRGHYELAVEETAISRLRSRSTSSPWPSDPEFSRRDFSMQWTGQMQQRPTEDSTSMPRGRLPPERSMPLLDGEKWQTYANKRENPSTGPDQLATFMVATRPGTLWVCWTPGRGSTARSTARTSRWRPRDA